MIRAYKKEDWLAAVIYPFVVVLMESFWIYPWVVWLGQLAAEDQVRPPLSFASVMVTIAVSLTVTRIFHKRDWRLGYIRCAIIGSGVIIMFLILRIEYGTGYGFFGGEWLIDFVQTVAISFQRLSPMVLAMPVVAGLWLRGIILGRATHYFENLYRSFIIGTAALILLILAWVVSPNIGEFDNPLSTIGLYALAFFLFGLCALAIRNVYMMRKRMATKETRTSVWQSLPLMLAVIGGIVVIGLLAATLFSPEFFDTIAMGLKALGKPLRKALYYLTYPFVYIADAVFRLLKWLISLIQKTETQETQGIRGSPLGEFEGETGTMPQIVTTILEAAVIIIIIAAIIFILAKAIRRIRERTDDDGFDETHESLWSKDTIKGDLRRLFSAVGMKFRRAPKPDTTMFDDEAGDLDPREIYKRLLWEAGRFGLFRRVYETPSEYAGRLGGRLSDCDEQLYRITNLYSRVRYGEVTATEEEILTANTQWVVLRTEIRRMGEAEATPVIAKSRISQ